MIIRTPTFADYDRIMELLIEMANYNELSELQNPKYNDRYIRNLITDCIKTGVVLVGEYDGKIEGVIIGAVFPNIWMHQVKWLREIAFWVSDKAKHTKLGVHLIMQFNKKGEYLIENEQIDNFVITSMEKLPVDYTKFGYHKLETNYSWSK